LSEDKQLILAANGEIYNHRELRKQFEGKYNFQTESDCEVILALYKRTSFIDEMNYFWFAIYDVEKTSILLPVITYYSITYWLGSTWNYVASELKALKVIAQKFNCFLQGIII
jgi:asparagine synthase (glutamine-hydrolysing)